MSKIKNDGLDQYGAVPFEQQQFETAGVEGVKPLGVRCQPSNPNSKQPVFWHVIPNWKVIGDKSFDLFQKGLVAFTSSE